MSMTIGILKSIYEIQDEEARILEERKNQLKYFRHDEEKPGSDQNLLHYSHHEYESHHKSSDEMFISLKPNAFVKKSNFLSSNEQEQ